MTVKALPEETIRAVATVTLDAAALDDLGSRTIDRLADLVAQRLAERQAAGQEPLLSTTQAACAAGVHVETVRRAIRSGALEVAGYVGHRPRMRRADVETWVATGRRPQAATVRPSAIGAVRRPAGSTGVLGNALRAITRGEAA